MGRMEKVNQQIKREIGQILQQEISDPRLEFVSIMTVQTSKDLRSARVYYSVLGDSKKHDAAHQGLEKAAGFIRKLLGNRLNIRYTPQLTFIYDDSIETSARIEETIKEIHDDV